MGLAEFVSYTKKHDIPLYIVSGGIDFFIHQATRTIWAICGVYCNESDFSKETIQIEFPHSCDESMY